MEKDYYAPQFYQGIHHLSKCGGVLTTTGDIIEQKKVNFVELFNPVPSVQKAMEEGNVGAMWLTNPFKVACRYGALTLD